MRRFCRVNTQYGLVLCIVFYCVEPSHGYHLKNNAQAMGFIPIARFQKKITVAHLHQIHIIIHSIRNVP